MTNKSNSLLPSEVIQSKIYVIRGYKVLVDRQLAELYGIRTADLKRAVKRNIERFPADFMIELNAKEMEILRYQFGTLGWGNYSKYKAYAFTEQGIAMLSSVLNSPKAIQINIQIIRVFVQLRELLSNHVELRKKIEDLEKKYDARLNKVDHRMQSVFEAFEEIKSLLEPPPDTLKNKVGFV